jgi:hypothetical protein
MTDGRPFLGAAAPSENSINLDIVTPTGRSESFVMRLTIPLITKRHGRETWICVARVRGMDREVVDAPAGGAAECLDRGLCTGGSIICC